MQSSRTALPGSAPSLRVPHLEHSALLVPGGAGGTPSLRVLAFPSGFFELVAPEDAATWARFNGSKRRRGMWMRGPYVDDRAMLTVCSCTQAAVAAHWVSHSGEEQLKPAATSPPFGRCDAIQTWVGQAFILRLRPQQQVIVCGLRLVARPPQTNGRLVVIVADAAETRLDGFTTQCDAVLAEVGDDPREPPEHQQGRAPAPPPPGGTNRRGPWG